MSESTETKNAVDYAEQRRARSRERSEQRVRRVWLIAGAVLLGIVVLLVGAEFALSSGRIHPGVTVSGVKVGGMTPSHAKSVLEGALPKVAKPVEVVYEGKTWKVEPDDVGLDFDFEKTTEAAMTVGRGDDLLVSAGERVRAWAAGVEVTATLLTDPQSSGPAMRRIAEGIDVHPVDAAVSVSGTDFAVVDGKDGRALDRAATLKKIAAAMMVAPAKVTAKVDKVTRAVDEADAKAAIEVARRMVDGTATVAFGTKSWSFTPEEVASWLEFRRSDVASDADPAEYTSTPATDPAHVTLETYVSQEALRSLVLPKLGTGIGRPAQDASFTTTDGRVRLVPSEEGVGPDLAQLSADLTTDLKDSASDRSVDLRTTITQPELTTAKAQAMGISERISRYTTTYIASNRPRVNNIHLLGDALDGTLIPPDGTFSFNGTVGERTADKGYQEANAIVDGKLVPQLGGGICQVGTTLFNTVFESGLPVLERHNHSFYISHYPKGRDATVSWGGPDLKFKNDTGHWILLSVSYTSGSITIALYGTDPGYEVSSNTSGWSNERPFPTEEIKDPLMYVGTRAVEDGGITGRRCTVTREVTKDGTVVRTDEFVSVYRPKVEVVRVGTKPKPGSKPATSTAKP